jgi:predicted ATPase/DNA-binding winged helix-turn-helix (wHTH) protein
LRIDRHNQEVWRGTTVVKLTRRPLEVLCCLVSYRGTVVTKEFLFTNVWHADGVVVGDAALTTCIRAIRKALQDSIKTPQYIETVAKFGYRFIGQLANPEDFPRLSAPDSWTPEEDKRKTSHPPAFLPGPSRELLPIVGREAELAKLHSILTRMLAGERQFVFVTGEAGIGKTSLVRTFLRQVAAPGEIGICFGQCIEQFGPGEPYRPVLEAIGRACRDPRGAFLVEWMKQYTPTWLLQMPTFISTEDLDVLERKTQGATRERMLREMTDGVGLLTEQMPLILVLEDLHWSDTSTLDFLALLARRQERARIMVIGTYRPAEMLTEEHPLGVLISELLGHKLAQELALRPLDEPTVQAYIEREFPTSAFPTRLPHVLYQNTGGNPLFLTVIVDDLKDRGVIALGADGHWMLQGQVDTVLAEVPDSIRQLLERQMGKLPAEEQQILQAASIAGFEFSAAAVAAAINMPCADVEVCCDALVRRRHFLQPAGYSEWPDGIRASRYRFRHAVYQYLWAERGSFSVRQQYHLRIGQRLEAAYGGRSGEIAAELALHFEQGSDYPRALGYLQQAARNALRRYSHQEAIVHLTKGLKFLPNLPTPQAQFQQELNLRIALGSALIATKGYSAEEVESSYSRALELCRSVGESPKFISALLGIESFYAMRGKFLMAHEIGERCLRLAQHQDNQHRLLLAHWTIGQVLSHMGNLTVARAHLQQAIMLNHPKDHRAGVLQDPGVTTLAYLAKVLWLMGYPDQAQARIQESLLLADSLSHPFSKAFALTFAADIYASCGKIPIAYHHAQESIALCQEQGFAAWLAFALVYYGRTLCLREQLSEGIEHIHRGLEDLKSAGAEASQPLVLAFLAEACARQGHATEGLDYVATALALVEQNDERFHEAELYRLQGEFVLQSSVHGPTPAVQSPKSKVQSLKPRRLHSVSSLSRPSTSDPCGKAEAYFRKALDIARQQQAKSWELRAAMSLARLWHSQDRTQEAYELLTEVHQWFQEGETTKDLTDASDFLATLAAAS